MARRGALTFGSLNPFGGSNLSFGSFNVGGTSGGGGGGATTVDPSKEAYLEFQRIETEYNAGRISDAEYQAAFQNYMGYLDAGTSEYYNAQARLDDMQYSAARDALLSAIQAGQRTWSDMVAFDQQSLAGLNPGSREYRDREGRLWTSQNNEFAVAERKITTDLSAGRITNTQAMEWYENARQFYPGNGELLSAIEQTIEALGSRVIAEQDQLILDQWREGTIGIDALIAYGEKSIAEDPVSDRARTWADNIETAKTQAVETSLAFRYKLTEEYRDLAALVASMEKPTGHTSTSTSWQSYVDASGKWVTRAVTKSKYHAPSASEQEAYAKRVAQAAEAKKRMAAIEKQVGALPGGWVTEDDIIANLAAQQAKMDPSNPEWLAIQEKIDYYSERKAADEQAAKAGLRVNLPTVASERTAGNMVGGFEKPVPPSSGKTTMVQPKTAGGTGGGGGGTGGGTAAARGGAAPTALGGILKEVVGKAAGQIYQPRPDFLMTAEAATSRARPGAGTTERVQTVDGQWTVVYKRTGLPVGMTPQQWTPFMNGMRDAVRNGETTYTDPQTQVTYLLPADPEKRLDIIMSVNDRNIQLKQSELVSRASRGVSTKAAMTSYNKAVRDMATDAIYVMDQPDSTLPGSIPKEVKDTFSPGLHVANPLAVTLAWQTAAEREGAFLERAAQEAIDRGDFEAAYAFIRSGLEQVVSSGGLAERARKWAAGTEQQLAVYGSMGGEAQGQVKTDVERMRSMADASWMQKTYEGIEKLGALFTNEEGGLPLKRNPKTGQPIVNPQTGSFELKDGFQYTIQKGSGGSGDKIVVKYMPNSIDYQTGKPAALDPNKSLVMLQVGATWKPVLVDHEIKPVGRVIDSNGVVHEVSGKVVEISFNGRQYVIAQDPFSPSRWVPINEKGLEWRLPSGISVADGSTQIGKTGTQLFFTMANESGRKEKYGLALQDDGTYALWKEVTVKDAKGNSVTTMQMVGNAGDPQWSGIIRGAGINLDRSGFTTNQKLYSGAGLPGVWAGDAQRIDSMARTMREAAYGDALARTGIPGPRMDTYGGITSTWARPGPRMDTYGGITSTWATPSSTGRTPGAAARGTTPLAPPAARVGYATTRPLANTRQIIEPGAGPTPSYNAPIYSSYVASIVPTASLADQAATARLSGLAAVYAATPTLAPAATPRLATSPSRISAPTSTPRVISSTQVPSKTTRQIIEPPPVKTTTKPKPAAAPQTQLPTPTRRTQF